MAGDSNQAGTGRGADVDDGDGQGWCGGGRRWAVIVGSGGRGCGRATRGWARAHSSSVLAAIVGAELRRALARPRWRGGVQTRRQRRTRIEALGMGEAGRKKKV
jgi:hypothetical protein